MSCANTASNFSSGAAQAARCLDYTAQEHPNVEPIRPYDVVGIELRAEWVDMNASSGGRGGEPLASADAANGKRRTRRRAAGTFLRVVARLARSFEAMMLFWTRVHSPS